MARRPLFGVSNYKKKTYKKRPGRHAKNYSKRIPHRKPSVGQGWQLLQVVNYFFTKHYKLTSNTNIFLASLLVVTYVNYMDNFSPSNCVVHEDDIGFGG